MEKLTNKKIIKTNYGKVTKEKGITLIALVITIIVLLILAGVSIATLTGENGILKKANEAKDKTNIANVKEMAQTDILGYQAENESEEITIGQLKDVLSKYFKDVPDEEQLKEKLKDTDYSLKVKEEYGGDSIEVRVSDIYAAKLEELAKDVLKVNPDATNDYEKSPYVKYNGILCRVFYNDTEHGLQIISADNIKTKDSEGNDVDEKLITLGKDDPNVQVSDFAYEGSVNVNDNFKKAATSYNNAVDTLNKEASKYMSDDGIALDARSLGSIAKLKGGKFQGDTTTEKNYTNDHDYFSEYKNQFKPEDDNYKEDVGQLKALGLNATSYTWLASRIIDANSSITAFYVRNVNSGGYVGSISLCYVYSYGYAHGDSYSYGFRPVFLLSSNVKIKGDGNGTKDRPYELEI